MSMSVREGYETALALSRDSDEVLYYGRVFAESVRRNVVFRREVSGVGAGYDAGL
jgi:hypothetical protein